jgi:hypothetical protein
MPTVSVGQMASPSSQQHRASASPQQHQGVVTAGMSSASPLSQVRQLFDFKISRKPFKPRSKHNHPGEQYEVPAQSKPLNFKRL